MKHMEIRNLPVAIVFSLICGHNHTRLNLLDTACHGVEAHGVEVSQQRLAGRQLGLPLADGPALEAEVAEGRPDAELGGVARPGGLHQLEDCAGVQLVEDRDGVLALQLEPAVHVSQGPGVAAVAGDGAAGGEVLLEEVGEGELGGGQLGLLLAAAGAGEVVALDRADLGEAGVSASVEW